MDAGRGMAGEPSGGRVGVNFGNWALDGSLGVYNGSVVGGAAVDARLNQHWSLKAGDQSVKVGIPTEMDFSSGLLARGASFEYAPTPATRIGFFGGLAGGGYASTNVLFFTSQIALGAVSIDHYLDQKRRFLLFGRALFSSQQTILGGALYQTEQLQTGFAAGTGSNQPHAEGLLNYRNKQWEVRSGYRYSGERFQLLTLPQFRYAQQDRENADVTWHPRKTASLTLERHNYLEPPASGNDGIAVRGATNMAGGTLSFHALGVGTNVFESRFRGIYASAASFLVSIRLTNTVHLSGNYFLPLHSTNPMPMLTFHAEENLNRRVKLAEFATHVNGRWTISYGGGLRWDRFDVNIGYSTDFAPLATGGGRFKQTMNVNGHLNLSRWQFSVNTYVQPDGSLLYGYEVKTFYFHPTANGSVQAPQSHSSLGNFLITGQVRLQGTGRPVADVPVRIGSETVYTDEAGVFNLRVSRKRAEKIQLLLDRKVGVRYYEYVSGPAEVMPGTDEAPGHVEFVVRVNQTKAPDAQKGGLVIGNVNSSLGGTTPETISSADTN
jgi:hypothetical protein